MKKISYIFSSDQSSIKQKEATKKNNILLAFTLVEMIVSVTISIFLLGAISIFLGNGMESVIFQKQNLESIKQNSIIYTKIFNTISGSSNFTPIYSNSGVILKISKRYNKGGFAYIGEKKFDKKFCQSGSTLTNHLIIKTFIPFEYPGADFLAGTTYKESNSKYVNFFRGKIVGLTTSGNFIGPTDYLKISGKTYISDTLDHTIKDKNGNVVVGKSGIFGNYFKQGIDAKEVLLNNPTGLTYGENKLFFSDTLNNRILYLESGKIYKLLDESDGIYEPTGLFYDNSRHSLFIANSGNGNILEFSSSGITNNPDLEFKGFKNNITKFEVEFLNSSGTGGFVNLTGPTATGSFIFDNNPSNSKEDFITLTGAKITYFFEEYTTNSETNQGDCNSGPFPKYIINSSGEHVKCTQTGTGILSASRSVNLDNKQIKISDIKPDFSSGDNYFVKVDMGGETRYFPYFTKSDNLVSTKNDNSLREIGSNLNLAYPTGIKVSGNNLIVNTFLDRKKHTIKISDGTEVGSPSNIGTGNFNNFKNLFDNHSATYISSFPIEKIFLEKNSNNLLTIILNTYKKYDCLDNSKNIKSTEIIKKIIK